MSDLGPEEPTPTPLAETAGEAAAVVLSDQTETALDVRQAYITGVTPGASTYSIKFPESTASIPGCHSILPVSLNDTVWVLTRGAMAPLILGPQDKGGVPPGAISMWPTATPPEGWLLCNGQSTASYPRLAAIVGANVPDMRSRVPIGAGQGSGLTNRSLLGTGGSEALESHTHSTPAHTHTFAGVRYTTNANHTHQNNSGLLAEAPDPWTGVGGGITTASGGSGTSGSQGSGSAGNMPPFIGVHFIIRW